MLPDGTKKRAEEQARHAGISFGEFVRQSLESELAIRASGRDSARRARDPLFRDFDKLVAKAGPCPGDGAENHDKYLYGE
jgi:hypothetical protein